MHPSGIRTAAWSITSNLQFNSTGHFFISHPQTTSLSLSTEPICSFCRPLSPCRNHFSGRRSKPFISCPAAHLSPPLLRPTLTQSPPSAVHFTLERNGQRGPPSVFSTSVTHSLSCIVHRSRRLVPLTSLVESEIRLPRRSPSCLVTGGGLHNRAKTSHCPPKPRPSSFLSHQSQTHRSVHRVVVLPLAKPSK